MPVIMSSIFLPKTCRMTKGKIKGQHRVARMSVVREYSKFKCKSYQFIKRACHHQKQNNFILRIKHEIDFNSKKAFVIKDDTIDELESHKEVAFDKTSVQLTSMKIVESGMKKNVIVKGKKDGEFVAGMLSLQNVNGKECNECIKTISSAFEETKKNTDIKRGENKTMKLRDQRYILFGRRKDPLGKKLEEYVHEFKTGKKTEEKVKKSLKEVTTIMRKKGKHVLPIKDTMAANLLFQGANVEFEKGSQATQMAVAKCYMSKIHKDDDYTHSVLTAWNCDSFCRDQILQYFVFPEYKVAFPMRHGDVLFFNPQVLHGCTAPRHKNCVLMSAYTSAKTINTHRANQN